MGILPLIVDLKNHQLLTHADNTAKGKGIDRHIIQHGKKLRAQGMHGPILAIHLVAEMARKGYPHKHQSEFIKKAILLAADIFNNSQALAV